MSYIRKYHNAEDGYTVYIVSSKQNRPGRVSVNSADWSPYSVGSRTSNVIEYLKALDFRGEDKPKPEVSKEEKTDKKASILARLDKVAEDVQAEGREDIALAIDQFSDLFEGK